MSSRFIIRPTRLEDFPALLALFAHARERMRASGNLHQWPEGTPSEAQAREDIAAGVSYVLTLPRDNNAAEEIIVGTFACIEGRDPTYARIESGSWRDDHQPYATLHRIAGRSEVHHVMRHILDWAEARYDALRIDTHADNRPMLHLLEQAGFEFRGIIHVADGTPRRAFQRFVR